MPNHCTNRVTVLGPAADVAAFVDKAHGPEQMYRPSRWEIENAERTGRPLRQERKSSVFSFHALIPIPPDVEAREYDPAGYDAERERWGVKWGAYDEQLITVEQGRAEYRFTTAWSPPYTFLQRVSLTWPGLTFLVSYSEEWPSRGRAIIAAGAVRRLVEDRGGGPAHPDDECDEAGPNGGCAACARHDAWCDLLVASHDAWVLTIATPAG